MKSPRKDEIQKKNNSTVITLIASLDFAQTASFQHKETTRDIPVL
ncbi:hypothetical protein VULLAG_LOCUS2991 [Vulpes lagopus]